VRLVLPLNSDDVELSFLPLSHIFQRHADYASMLAGASIAYAENLTTVGDNMKEVRPTFAAGVPRFFEKVRSTVLADVHSGPGLRRRVFHWALGVGMKAVRTNQRGFQHSVADRLVLRKIREHLGGHLRWFISGGAALEKEVAEFFFAVGIPILEGYGLTETSPVIALNGPDDPRIGSVGKLVGDVEVRVAADGEILVRGSNVMKGYFGRLADTSEALRDGWFHTGDIGKITPEGYLQITDRKKDLIITSSGKNVAPQPIENRLKLVPYFDNVVLIGDRRHFLTALIVPNMDAIMEYAREHQIEYEDPSDLLQRREIYDLAMSEIDRRSSDLSNYERVRKVAFLKHAFSIDGGELTPTLKVRRSVVEKKFRESIDELYAA
jgi:long-chain acyl-CoA synthetase